MNIVQRDQLFKYGSALAALLLWGSWAFWVNREASWELRLLSSAAQAAASFVITLLMANSVAFFYKIFRHNYSKLIAPPLLTSLLTGSCLVAMHTLIGTQQVLHTVAPALSVGLLFCAAASWRLFIEENNNGN